MGVDFFRKEVALQKQYANGNAIHYAIQTNGTLLDDEWVVFLAENKFLVGLSIDGPLKLHDTYRVDKKGGATYERVMHRLKLFKKHGVEFNTLTVVNSQKPREVYRFLKEIGSGLIQFIPLVECLDDSEAKKIDLDLAIPPRVDQEGEVLLPVPSCKSCVTSSALSVPQPR